MAYVKSICAVFIVACLLAGAYCYRMGDEFRQNREYMEQEQANLLVFNSPSTPPVQGELLVWRRCCRQFPRAH